MAVEQAEYRVVFKEDRFEVREYPPLIVAETLVEGDFEDVGNEAFGRLFKYISGNNQLRQNVEMTAPVGQTAESQKIRMTSPVGQQQVEGRWAVSFMMPASSTLETLPEPKDQTVVLRQVPARHMAAVRYSGFWSEEGYMRNKTKLEAWIDEQGFIPVGEPVWARYNPPFMPWFLRRNEILVPIDECAAQRVCSGQ
ncbi:MAG: hypothetical protein ACI9W6_002673 [Motiliproteus sp.]|jgi:hypothetical protein